jgi:hypothetical protein
VRSNRFRLPVALLAGLLAATAAAYDFIRASADGRLIKWGRGTVTFQLKLGQARTLSDGSNFNTSFTAAMDEWNAVIANVQLAGTAAAEGVGGDNNDINEAFFAADTFGRAFGESTIAVTTTIRTAAVQPDGSYRRLESDIVFNSARAWDSYRGPLRASTEFRRVALHELGHSLGLAHPDEATPPQSVSAVMNSRTSSVDSLRQDDILGAQELYGSGAAAPRPANDAFADGVVAALTTSTGSFTGSNVRATKEVGEPNHAPSEPGGASVWWRWTAPAAGSLTVTTAGSDYDTLLAAYTGSAVNALTQLAANDDVASGVDRTSSITFAVTAGTVYHLAVDGWQGDWGRVTLNLSFTANTPPAIIFPGLPGASAQGAAVNPAPGPPTITVQPQNQAITAGGTATFSVTATGTPAPTFQWSRNGTAVSGATGATLTIAGAQATDAASYTVTVTNSAGSVTSTAASLTVTAPPPPPPSGGGGGGGGGGSPSLAFAGLAAAALLARALRRRG